MNIPSNQPNSASQISSPPGDVTRLVNIVKDKIEEANVDDDVQQEIAIILNLLAEFKEQDVLENKREPLLAAIGIARLTHRAIGRIAPEGFIVGAPIVITREPEPRRRPKNQKRR